MRHGRWRAQLPEGLRVGTPFGTPPAPTARTGPDRLDRGTDLSCGDGSGGTQRTGLSVLELPREILERLAPQQPQHRVGLLPGRPARPRPRVTAPALLVVAVHRHEGHLHPCLSGVQPNRERWTDKPALLAKLTG